eukprot:TRINITY_DN47800_c0_g1_i1.p1 TRINITY_DN47800_c0_g1~~TRINITY_DN47800_c0_g1_i1.p1  ORF type:complete len:432 (-),score=54.62 TRINITY_DN47800_c0_g1_i1:127-1353(-)
MTSNTGPFVLYGSFVSTLFVNFFIFPTLLLTGRKAEENVWRHTSLMSMCVLILLDLVWANVHPRPLGLGSTAAAAALSGIAFMTHLLLAYGVLRVVEYSFNVGMALQLVTAVPWIFVQQLGTAFVVSSGRSPARFQMLAWITVMILGTLVTMYPTLRQNTLFVVGVASSPRLIVAAVLFCARLLGPASTGAKSVKEKGDGNDSYSIALPRAFGFTLFACNGTLGEAINDMATELTIRGALKSGETSLTIAYNIAVILSMCAGFVSDSMASSDGARRIFSLCWAGCQVFRSCSMHLLSSDHIWLMFAFVFGDKFTGPLGQSAIDTALLKVMQRGRDESTGKAWPRIPANAMWTLRTATERLERPLCQLVLLRFGAGNAPPWLPITLTLLSVSLVQFTLRSGSDEGKKEA